MVYMRREVVGRREMNKVTLRTLGLVQGKGLFRFFFKKPEQLRVQANVYDMKEKEKSEPKEMPHVPMRLAPDNTKEPEPNNDKEEESPMEVDVDPKPSTTSPLDTKEAVEHTDTPTASKENEKESRTTVQPDSTQPEPVINHIGPNNAIVFSAEDGNSKYQDIDDDFFELSLDEVKSMYKDLKMEVKRLTEGEIMQTKEMRESQKEGEKVKLLSKYNSCVIRIQFPSRHVIQGKLLNCFWCQKKCHQRHKVDMFPKFQEYLLLTQRYLLFSPGYPPTCQLQVQMTRSCTQPHPALPCLHLSHYSTLVFSPQL